MEDIYLLKGKNRRNYITKLLIKYMNYKYNECVNKQKEEISKEEEIC